MDKKKVTRDGQPPITFTGELLSQADNKDHNSTRWTTITIYRTKGGKFVAKIERRTQWQGERDSTTAEVCEDFGQVIAWLTDEDGDLRPVSQEAVEAAIKLDPSLAKFWVQEID